MSHKNIFKILDFSKSNKQHNASEKTAQGKHLKTIFDSQIDYKKNTDHPSVAALIERYSKARILPIPKSTRTVPDPAVAVLMETLYGHGGNMYMDIHREAMTSENLVGKLLEFYIAENIEPMGWIWCAGELVQSIDFIKNSGNSWELLQVKNRSNSENSSSKKVREGTHIKHWFRIDAASGITKWEHFPDKNAAALLSEHSFHDYIKKVSTAWKR